MSLKKKVVWLPYDMDTAIGINNEGELVFDYQLEDIDHQQGGANIFNGQDSVIWKNIRACFPDELKAMYRSLRSSGALSYQKVEQMFEEHQGTWSEAIFNEDARFKYIDPFVINNQDYLGMLLGSKAEQRKWWLYNRFRYIDSKYIAGDAMTDTITLRPYAADDISITPYADIYATIAWDAKITQERCPRNTTVTLECPYESMNDNVVTIYSASQLASIGDVSGLQVGVINISNATRIQNIKIGDPSSTYDNTNLRSLTLGNNVLLQSLDVRNCSGLGNTSLEGHTQQTVDISGCSIIEDVYFSGTNITGLTFPNGGVVKDISLPNTITNLTILNQPSIQTFSMDGDDYSNISTLRIENCSSAIPVIDILSEMSANSRVRIIGFSLAVTSTQDVEDFYDYLDTMRGLDENGNNLDNAVVSGRITGLDTITGAWLAEMQARYPDIAIEYNHITSNLYYFSYDGTTLLYTEAISDGGDGTYSGTPSRPSTAQYDYTFVGWSKNMNSSTADADAQTDVIADRTIYAAYTSQVRTYTVRFYNGSTLLETDTGVPYGGSTTYDGATPVSPDGSATDYPFEGWSPQPTNIQGDTSCYAQFGSPVEVVEITDSWDTIIASIDDGTYSSKYSIGNYKPLDLGTEGVINMQIVAFDADELSSGGYAPITFISIPVMETLKAMGGSYANYETSAMRSYLDTTVKALVPNNVATRIKSVKKYQAAYYDGAVHKDGQVTDEYLWIPSFHEMLGTVSNVETVGVVYDAYASNKLPLIKQKVSGSGGTWSWWTRTAITAENYARYTGSTTPTSTSRNNESGVVLGFCLGLEPETITDSWETILANENPSESYSIGDTKYLDMGTEGNVLMEIVAFNTDDKADGSGKAKITWISKNLLNTAHRMNPADSSGATGTGGNGGWENCEMRTYLKNTIKPLIPDTVRNAIVPVTKVQCTITNGSMVKDGQTSTEDVWIPSHHEVFPTSTTYESTGVAYTKFSANTDRIKNHKGSASGWSLRTPYDDDGWIGVRTNGGIDYLYSYSLNRIALGFCT